LSFFSLLKRAFVPFIGKIFKEENHA